MLKKNRLMTFVALITLMAPIAVGCGKPTTRIIAGGKAANMAIDCGTQLPGVLVDLAGVEVDENGLAHFTWQNDEFNPHNYKIFLCNPSTKQGFEYVSVTDTAASGYVAKYVSDGQVISGANVRLQSGSVSILNFDVPDARAADIDHLTVYIQAI